MTIIRLSPLLGVYCRHIYDENISFCNKQTTTLMNKHFRSIPFLFLRSGEDLISETTLNTEYRRFGATTVKIKPGQWAYWMKRRVCIVMAVWRHRARVKPHSTLLINLFYNTFYYCPPAWRSMPSLLLYSMKHLFQVTLSSMVSSQLIVTIKYINTLLTLTCILTKNNY